MRVCVCVFVCSVCVYIFPACVCPSIDYAPCNHVHCDAYVCNEMRLHLTHAHTDDLGYYILKHTQSIYMHT